MSQNCTSSILLHGREVLEKSAHRMFQMGQYYDCLETPGFSYNFVQLAYGGTNVGVFGGLCLPEACTKSIITEEVNTLLVLMGMPYQVGTITDDIQNYRYPFTWVFYLTMIILMLMISLVLYVSFSKSKNKYIQRASLQQSMKILKYKQPGLNIFNGVRALAMMWVVFGHYYLSSTSKMVNTMSIAHILEKPFLLLVENGLTAVDIFFFLGGFFLAFTFMKKKQGSSWKFLLAIIQRVLRIWPAYILAMMIYYSVLMHLGQGPQWSSQEIPVKFCKNMWRSILFVDNLVQNGEEICLSWGWYLQVDFQIFVACIFLLFLYERVHRTVSYATAVAMIVGSLAFNISYTQKNQTKLLVDIEGFSAPSTFFTDVYIKPYGRWNPYIMGLFVGLFYYQYQQCKKKGVISETLIVNWMLKLKEKFEKNKFFRIAVEWIGTGIMAFLMLIVRTLQIGHNWPQILHSLYSCLEKPLFIFGLLMVTLPTILGCKGSFFQLLLNNKLLDFLAKISYCTYLIHVMVMIQYNCSRTYDNYYSLLTTFPLYLGCLVVSCCIGFLMTIFVELPFSAWQKEIMEKIMMKEKRYAKEYISESLNDDKINQTIANESESMK